MVPKTQCLVKQSGGPIFFFLLTILRYGYLVPGNWFKLINSSFTSHSTLLNISCMQVLPFFIIYYSNIFLIFDKYFKNKENFSFNFIYPLLGYLMPSLMNDNFDLEYLPLIIALGLFNPKI